MSDAFIEDKDDKKFLAIMEAIKNALPNLSRDMHSALRVFLPEVRNIRDAQYLIDWMREPMKWRYPKVSVDTFLDSKKYLWIWNTVYPKIREAAKAIIEGWFKEWVVMCGIWAGKSFLASILACYAAQHLLCLRTPHENYRLTADKNIAIINMWINATQAKEVVFTGIRWFIWESPFFKQFNPKLLSWTILFESQKILLASGNSKATTPLWYNVFYAILDEAAFYTDTAERDVAQEIYITLQRRIVSRFWDDWLLMMISSPRYTEDFIMKKYEESGELDENWDRKSKHIYSLRLPTRKVKFDWNRDSEEYFYFNPRLSEIIKEENISEQLSIRTVNYIETSEFDDTFDLWEIPNKYKISFQQNPDQAKRDFWATPSLALAWFFPSAWIIRDCYDLERENPLKAPGKYEFKVRPLRMPYYVHIDIGFNRDGKGDHTGFAMGHFWGRLKDEATGETRMKFVIDLVEQIGVQDWKGEVELSEVRNRIYDLRAMWFNIALVTLDWYMSKDVMQILRKKSIKADYLSVDRTIDPYNILKAAFYEKRIDLPYYEPLEKELMKLELVRWIKVDHNQGWCFTWDTRIALADWTCPTMEELVWVDEFYVYSIDEQGMSIKKAWNCRVTKETNHLVEILLDNFTVIRCTPEHLFMTLDKEWIQAQELNIDVQIMPLYRTVNLKWWWAEYEEVWCPIRKKRLYTHKLSVWLPWDDMVAHHIDSNKRNNDPRNLIIMSRKEHHSHHGKERWNLIREKMRAWYDKLEHTAKHSEHMKELWASWVMWPTNQKCCIEWCERIRDAKWMCDMHYQRAKRAWIREKYNIYHNHRALSVKHIYLDNPIKVYDITVPETENFALANWVIVHNSKDVADAVAWVVANINEHTHSGDMWVRNSMSNMTEKEKYDLEMAKKAKYYTQMQKAVDRQDEIMNARGL